MSLIDRGYLRKMIMFEPQFEFCGEKEKDVQTTLRAIEECPTVEAEPVRHGYWTDKHKCSVCGGVAFSEYNVYPVYDFDCNGETFFAVDYGYDLVYHETDFCPFCGAKMNKCTT